MSNDKGIDEESAVHIHNGKFSAIKKNKVMWFARKQKQLEIITLSKFSESQINNSDFLSCVVPRVNTDI